MSDGSLIMIAVVAFVLGAFYSGSETAFIAADRIRLRHLAGRGNRRAQRVLALVDEPEFFLSAVLVGTNLAVIGCTTVFTALVTRRYGESGDTIATLVLVPMFLVFNEIIPKGLFLYYANRAALLSVDVLRVLTTLFYPVVKLFSLFADLMTRALPERDNAGRLNVSMEEMLFHIGDSQEAGLIAPETSLLVERAVELKGLTARDVMTPLDRIVMLDADQPADSYGVVFAREGFSRCPVYRGERTNVLGVMSVHEYMSAGDPARLRDNLIPPYAISVDTPIVDVLFEMRERGRHMAMVTDAAGVVVGMTTLEDILERFVGAIADEFH